MAWPTVVESVGLGVSTTLAAKRGSVEQEGEGVTEQLSTGAAETELAAARAYSKALQVEVERLLVALPDPKRLEALALWVKETNGGFPGPDVMRTILRSWAEAIRAVLAK